jgi:hypothetical protein
MVRKMKNMMANNYRKAAVAAAAIAASGQALALDAAQNTAITDGYTAVEVTVAVVIAGLLGVILGIAGWSIIKGLLK